MTLSDLASPTELFLETSDGLRLFTRHWQPATAPRAAIVLCHGVNSHSGHYGWAARQFVKAGYAVTALDLRWRGRSQGERFYVDSIDDYVADLAQAIALAKAYDPGLKVYLLGHSAGGVTACSFALDHQAEIDGLICESFAFHVYAPDFALTALKGLSFVTPHLRVLHLRNEDFSRDPEWVRELNDDPLIANEVQPVQTVAAFARAGDRLTREFDRITLPVLILHGTADKATRPDGSAMFFGDAGSADKQLRLYDGHYHDLLNDYGREQVMADILKWIDQRADPRTAMAMPGPALDI